MNKKLVVTLKELIRNKNIVNWGDDLYDDIVKERSRQKNLELTSKIRDLYKAGANFQYELNGGNSPLIHAIRWGYQEFAPMLIEDGANVREVESFGNTPSHHAVQNNNNLEIVKQLIEAGAVYDLDLKNNLGETPLELAKPEIRKYLYEIQEYIDGKNLQECLEEYHVAINDDPKSIEDEGVDEKLRALNKALNYRYDRETSFSKTEKSKEELKNGKVTKKSKLKKG